MKGRSPLSAGGQIQLGDAYLGGELSGGNAGRRPENKIPIVASVSLNKAGHPIHAGISVVSGFHSDAIADWAQRHMIPGSQALPQWLLLLFKPALFDGCHD